MDGNMNEQSKSINTFFELPDILYKIGTYEEMLEDIKIDNIEIPIEEVNFRLYRRNLKSYN